MPDGRVRTRPRSLSQLYWSSTSIYPVINNETAVLTGHSTPTTSPLVKTKLYLFLFVTVNANAHSNLFEFMYIGRSESDDHNDLVSDPLVVGRQND